MWRRTKVLELPLGRPITLQLERRQLNRHHLLPRSQPACQPWVSPRPPHAQLATSRRRPQVQQSDARCAVEAAPWGWRAPAKGQPRPGGGGRPGRWCGIDPRLLSHLPLLPPWCSCRPGYASAQRPAPSSAELPATSWGAADGRRSRHWRRRRGCLQLRRQHTPPAAAPLALAAPGGLPTPTRRVAQPHGRSGTADVWIKVHAVCSRCALAWTDPR